jgi:hypothetical protein
MDTDKTSLTECELRFFPLGAGGLKRPLTGNLIRFPVRFPGIERFENPDDFLKIPNFRGAFWEIFIVGSPNAQVSPGGEYIVTVEWTAFWEIRDILNVGMTFQLFPNLRHSGEGTIISFLTQPTAGREK